MLLKGVFINGRGDAWPALVRSERPGQPLIGTPELCARLEARVREHGALLLRGFALQDRDALRELVSSFGYPAFNPGPGSTPLPALGAGVYEASEYPPHRSVPLHHEQSHTRSWPLKLWFHCEHAALSGGAMLLADSRRIYERMPIRLRERFERDGLVYVRNYGGGLDVDWSRAFGTRHKSSVEQLLSRRGIEYEWFGSQQLCTRERVPAVARHPRSGELLWFNQAHMFHVSALPAAERAALLEVCGYERLPRHVYFGDGTPIEDDMLDEIRAVLEVEKRAFAFQTGDVLMLDNMLTAHGREPFSGPRSVLVAMAGPTAANSGTR